MSQQGRSYSRVTSAKGSQQQYFQQSEQKSSKNRLNSAQPISQKNVATVGLSELEKIKERIGIDEYSDKTRQQDKQELYEKSQKRIQNWPNTLQALRKKKGDAKFERFEKDEEERRRIDLEEYEYQQQEKQKIIEKANKQLYDQNDKVKTFQSKLLLMDALQERDEQIELKKQVKEIDKIRDRIHQEQLEERIRIMDQEEQRKREELERKKEEAARILKQQHDLQRDKYIKQYKENQLEGQIIKERAIQLLEQEKQEERLRKQRIMENQEATRKNNEYLATQRLEIQKKIEREDELIQKHAEKQDRIKEMRRLREQEIFKKKQDEKQKLIDAQTKRLAALKQKEDEILNKQIKEAEIKAEQAELIKKQKQQELKKRIDESIEQTLKKKRAQTAKEKLDDVQFQQFWHQKNQEIQKTELREKQEAMERAKELQNFHLQQAENKRIQREKNFLKELDEEEQLKRTQENEKTHFKSWAEKMINEWQKDGKDIKPLLKEFKKLETAI